MTPPDPALRLIGWATTRAAEAIVDRVVDRITIKMKTRVVATVRHRAAVAMPKRGKVA